MAEHDRLAELLARATRERRAGADEADGVDEAALPETGRRAAVRGGEWLPPEPVPGVRTSATGTAADGTPAEFTGPRHRAGRVKPRLVTWPESLRSVRVLVRAPAVLGVLLVVVLSGAVLGWRWWQAEQASQPVPVAVREAQSLAPESPDAPPAETSPDSTPVTQGPASTQSSGPGAEASDGASTDAETTNAEASDPARLVVHVAGQVEHPGVVAVAEGDRVLDAVEAAGGLTAQADTSRLNLARPLMDGERVWVPRPGEEVPEVLAEPVPAPGAAGNAGGSAAGAGGAAAGGAGGPGGAAAQINLNTADQATLEELPGVGPVTAAAILAWRADHGSFTSTDELLEVSGIGQATLEKLRPHVTL